MYKLTLDYDRDYDFDDHLAGMGWVLHSFSTRHRNFKHPQELGLSLERDPYDGLPLVTSPALRRKFKRNLAFIASYYEHGSCAWFLLGEGGPGTDCPFDGARVAGLVEWEPDDPKDLPGRLLKDRRESARRFLEEYTALCNGYVYGYMLEGADGELIDSCYGFVGDSGQKAMFEEIEAHVGDAPCEVDGDAAWLAAYSGLTIAEPV